MEKRLAETLSDPRIRRIILEASERGRITAKELCEADPSISRSTLYRLLAKLEDEGVLEVVDQTQKRGTVEKIYELRPGAVVAAECIPGGENSNAADVFPFFCMRFGTLFERLAWNGSDASGDLSGFQSLQVCGSDAEVRKLFDDIVRLVQDFQSKIPECERRSRSLGIIISPSYESQ